MRDLCDANGRQCGYNVSDMNTVSIVKKSGEREPFIEEKLKRSLSRSGAQQKLIDEVVAHIVGEVGRGELSTTDGIYRHAFKLLRKRSRMVASRYHLRRAIMELGPSGHPFEHFIARILEADGYKTTVGSVLAGACVDHEIDVLAEKDGETTIIECKFHNQQGIKSDVKTSLYVHARFEDIRKNGKQRFGVWLVTNTKLTGDAIRYAECVGMKAIGWSYPSVGNVQDLVERSGLHPVTCLTSLNRGQKQNLMERGIVVCRDLVEKPETLGEFNFSPSKTKKTLREAESFSRPVEKSE